ncbi:Scr1 family TA system antitoxin-like transcriptional regulator [Glycomyces sp. NPDC048151]|uniref:Scr1 family TA system antitoxin-like transcriptional regulator n=1 Tax=Glycomyces sp. NPDC048151 TaxID=3364002 RepID=UPI00371BE376
MPLSRLANWYVLAELNALSEETDLTQQQIADEIGVSSRTITNYLTGETRPKAGMAASFAKACGGNDKRANFLSHVIKQLDSGKIVSDLDQRNIFIIERAEATYGEMWEWEPWYIPGLLQDPRYHMDLLSGQTDHPMQNWQRKLRRQITVNRRAPQPTMRFLVGSTALKPLLGKEWGEAQFQRLVEADQTPNCEVRILDGLHRGVEHAFTTFHPSVHPKAGPSFVYVEALDQSRHIEEPVKIGLYDVQIKDLWFRGDGIGGTLDDWVH